MEHVTPADRTPDAVAPDHADDLALALRLADTADAITVDRFRAADLRVTRKPDRTPVTDADTATEDALRAVIGTERPGDAVLGEERGGEVPESGRGWVLDPIDGTKNFSRGVPAWATLIGLTVHGRAVVGVASAPALGRRWWGAAGLGAWASDNGGPPRRLAVSGVATSPTPTCPPPTSARSPGAATSTGGSPSPTPAGRRARSATSGSTASSPRA